MRTRDGFLVSFIAAGVLAAGCGGGQTGDLGGYDNGEATGGNCTEEEQALASVDADTDLGFSASDLLERVEGTHEVSLAWGASDAVEFSPSDATTNATFVIQCSDPNPRFVDSEVKQQGEGPLIGAEPGFGDSCPDSVRVDCELSITTEDGGLDESLAVVVAASSLDFANINQALEPDGFSGSFEIGEPSAANTSVKQLTLELSVSRFGVSGSIASVLETQHDGAVGASWVTYARFPAETCEGGGSTAFVVDENSDAGQASAAAVLEQLVPDADRDIDWDDGDAAAFTLALTPGETGCVEFSPYEEGMIAYYPASVQASSEDGRLDFTGEGQIRAHFDADEALTYAIYQASATPESEQIAALMGSSLEEAEALAEDYDEFELSLSQTYDMQSSMGYVRLLGAVIPDCVSNPPEPMESDMGGGTPGCEGIDQQVVFEGTWSP